MLVGGIVLLFIPGKRSAACAVGLEKPISVIGKYNYHAVVTTRGAG
jgi:hypothetical protein